MISFKKLGLISALLVLSGCVVESNNSNRPVVKPHPVQTACPYIYAPVCAQRNNVRKTLPNQCVANAQGYRVISQGECGSRPNNGWGNNQIQPNQPHRPRPPQLKPTKPSNMACTREFKPVCAIRGKDKRSFANACEAQRAGYRYAKAGQC
ncbi:MULTISPECIES: Kazal-type serine protease inhibitor domain-containing protein [Paenochrobactrum]|uniref:Kazal-type serine protease inhibitor domain-containing protein n=1 Tax=Paenochrobactrum TaxID=999488 RepID=UPI0035BC0282